MQTKNILFVARSFQMGGQEKISASILEYLADNGYHITCFACIFASSFMSENLEKKGIIFHTGSAFDLYGLMKSSHFDAVYVCAEFYSAIVLLLAVLCGIKVRITHTHQTQSETKWWKLLIKNYIFRPIINLLATKRLACSTPAGYFLYGKHTPFEWVRNGIDIKKFAFDLKQRKEMRQKLGVENKLVIGHIGRFYPTKNQIFLINMLAEMQKINSSAILLLAGKGESEQILKDQVKLLELEHKVIFYGETKNPASLYQAMDCFIMSSTGAEGLPLTALEAQCCGLPCFLSDTIPTETAVINTTFLPLQKGPKFWAERVLKYSTDFERKDESKTISKTGFSTDVMLRTVKEKYFDTIYDKN